jgi:hypothetical protein
VLNCVLGGGGGPPPPPPPRHHHHTHPPAAGAVMLLGHLPHHVALTMPPMCVRAQARLAPLPSTCLCWTPPAWWPGSVTPRQQQQGKQQGKQQQRQQQARARCCCWSVPVRATGAASKRRWTTPCTASCRCACVCACVRVCVCACVCCCLCSPQPAAGGGCHLLGSVGAAAASSKDVGNPVCTCTCSPTADCGNIVCATLLVARTGLPGRPDSAGGGLPPRACATRRRGSSTVGQARRRQPLCSASR